MSLQIDNSVVGTMDELEPVLRARGFTAVLVISGPMDLAEFDPYGMRRVGSVNIKTERWAHHVWRGRLATNTANGKVYLADAKDPVGPFVSGLFELVRA